MNDPRGPATLAPDTDASALDRGALARAIEALRASAAARDRTGGHAAQEKQWLADAGLLTLAVPRAFGGREAEWPAIYDAIRQIARVDSALAHLVGFQCLQVVSVDVWGNPAQRERYLRGTVEQRWWWGNAVNPLDTRLVATAVPDGGYRLDGVKGFCSGTRGSQRMTVSAHDPDTGRTVFGVVPTDRDGITVNDDWDPIGQRQTDSGSVRFDRVTLAPDEVLHRSETPPTPRATLRTLVSQLVLTNLFVGLAEGALGEARDYVLKHGRPWIQADVERASDDPYTLQRFGDMRVQAVAAAALADRAAAALQRAWAQHDALTADGRAEAALAVSEAKIVAQRAALANGEALFDACGARATAASLGLDRFWRNARTHTLHDPLDYRLRDVGRFALTGVLPQASLYT
ncbi:acyl-CoA dehydrogenase family protein [Burkholderia pseudomultivorans]|uniref:Dibenzothiophene desulfurization enzyme C n=1 Tax=Burkholderia pseudomultivorans TaxID=1207504 RepID=A0ABU2DWA3_9BURK|nr:acyl-CoA dehydrogenase family protein [Burkholderia pseudomultivorans]MDR8729025.1 Dibenzothiophene desulfurization enzyme C [Burkholderia pseudomultivorans]MDR8734962.1 Dibenzothiophene desulfurization enzyme C [Burkholderia pseudomultivorans]MDR8740769.1 Dibenzothiophene desulfurization enzyme C [Burkholderia pseudomultivorans]MDR8751857.1 Dibenzothiophene desulfurization enzyme C [Burkholderia pseudomultivorans]MDR8777183.1 Dibenzothiophene desulfurization enzyme C [Burkholderia pseudomu